MNRDRMLDLPEDEQAQIIEYVNEHATKRPVVYHIEVYQSEHNEYNGKQLWIADVDEFPNIGAYEDTLEEALKIVGESINWMIANQTPKETCPNCNEGKLHHGRGFWERDYKGHILMTPYSYFKCDSCSSELVDKEQPSDKFDTHTHKRWTDYGI
jgi:hypothetical protein